MLFFGYITEMAFCLLYQTWPSTRSKSTISICNQPGSQAPTLKYNMFRKYSARSSIHYMVMVKTTNDFTWCPLLNPCALSLGQVTWAWSATVLHDDFDSQLQRAPKEEHFINRCWYQSLQFRKHALAYLICVSTTHTPNLRRGDNSQPQARIF